MGKTEKLSADVLQGLFKRSLIRICWRDWIRFAVGSVGKW